MARFPPNSFPSESELRESGVQTLAFGLEGNTKFLDLFAVKYGFDYSRLHYGTSKSFINPSLQIVITPAEGWSIRTSLASRRANDSNTVVLPDGETLNLAEPTLITMVGNQASMSQIRHTEIAAEKTIAQGTAHRSLRIPGPHQGTRPPVDDNHDHSAETKISDNSAERR